MSEYHFLAGTGRLSQRTIRAVERVVREHCAYVVTMREPTGQWRYWLNCPNQGSGGRIASRCYAALRAAGLLTEDDLLPTIKAR